MDSRLELTTWCNGQLTMDNGQQHGHAGEGMARGVSGEITPRPTVPQIMTMPFTDENMAALYQQEAEEEQRRRKESKRYWPNAGPSGSLRQRLLPLVFM